VRVALLEHFSALPAGAAPPALLSAGGALLRAVAADLAALPGVTTEVVAGFHDGEAGFVKTLRRCDASLVVAPEEGGVLERLVRIAGRRRLLLGPGPIAVRLAADKRATARRLMERGIAVPGGAVVRRSGAAARLLRFQTPYVVKPRDGCGCEGVSIVRAPQGVAGALRRIDRVSRRRDLLVEEYVAGEPASVSFLVSRGRNGSGTPQMLCLGLNRQSVRGKGGPLRYAGGETPWSHPAAGEAVRLAARAVRALGHCAGDLCGYVGVDLVLAPDGPRVVEINPRLTTAYLGLRRVARFNLAGLMLDAALGRRLPRRLEVEGRCSFRPDGSVAVRAGRVAAP